MLFSQDSSKAQQEKLCKFLGLLLEYRVGHPMMSQLVSMVTLQRQMVKKSPSHFLPRHPNYQFCTLLVMLHFCKKSLGGFWRCLWRVFWPNDPLQGDFLADLRNQHETLVCFWTCNIDRGGGVSQSVHSDEECCNNHLESKVKKYLLEYIGGKIRWPVSFSWIFFYQHRDTNW